MKKIFLVEDNQDIREILDLFLTAEGFSVETFETVKDFDQRNSDITPDLYLFDVMLPDGSGIDLCNQIKNNSKHAFVPVIVMSANVKVDQMRNRCKPDDFISKPFDLNNFADRIKAVVDQQVPQK